MILNIIIVLFSLVTLIVIHEFGHFIVAKKFGVKVEEFGVGFPPRLFGKKIGETLYSLNLIPFGAFVKVYGENGGAEEIYSFGQKPVWQKMVIVLAGVLAFWLVGFILLSLVFGIGISEAISDDEAGYMNARVQIIAVAPDSPAQAAEILPGDIVNGFSVGEEYFPVTRVDEIQEFTENYAGEVVSLNTTRGNNQIVEEILIRDNPPEGQGAIGVMLSRVGDKSYGFFEAILKGAQSTLSLTSLIVVNLSDLFLSLVKGQGLPQGAQLVGPVGVGSIAVQATQVGAVYFLNFLAVISIYLAVFNLLPIPALDGGKLMFLIVEAFKGSPVNQKLEQSLTSISFVLLLILIVWITIQDIISFF